MKENSSSTDPNQALERHWKDFREALRELHRTNPRAAQAYLEGAARSLRGYAAALRKAGSR